jgi:hypothetical protein
MTIPLPRHDETAEDYGRRVRSTKRRNRLAVAGAVALVLGGFVLYAMVMAKPVASVGESCEPPNVTCVSGSWCLVGEHSRDGVCVAPCEPREQNACPAGMSCEPSVVVDMKGPAGGGTLYVCQDERSLASP